MGSDRTPSRSLPPRWRLDAAVRWAIAGLFFFAGVAAWAAPAVEGAPPGQPHLDLSVASAKPGQTVVATGSRFPRQTAGRLIWSDDGTVLAEFATDDAGDFTARVVVPDAPGGRHVVRATVGEETANAPLAVAAGRPATAARTYQSSTAGNHATARRDSGHAARSDGQRAPASKRNGEAKVDRTPVPNGGSGSSSTHRSSHASNNRGGGQAARRTPEPRQHGGAAKSGAARQTNAKKGTPKRPRATTQAGGAALTFTPDADARVEEANPSTNFGTSTKLRVDGGSDPDIETYLRVPVSGVGGNVTNATLRLYVPSGGGTADGPAVYAADPNWNESGIVWNNRPSRVGGPVGDKGKIAAGAWAEFDVTAAVHGNGTYAFALIPQSSDGANFTAREGSKPPQLVVTTDSGSGTTPTSTPTPKPTSTPKPQPTSTPKPNPTPTSTPTSGGGSAYYVDSANGNDGNDGRSQSAAWQSIAKANQASLKPGDSLLFKRGGNWTGGLKVGASGTANNPITIGSYGSGALPVIDGASSCVTLSGANLIVQEIQADDCSWAGLDITGSGNTVQNSLITHNVAGVHIHQSAVGTRILNNEIRDNNKMSVLTQSPSNDDSGAFGILLQGDRSDIANNTISGSDAFSYDYGRDGSAIEVYGGQNNLIHDNLAIDNDAFTELGNSRSSDNTYAYNVVRSSLATSTFVVTRGSGSGYGPVQRTKLLNNTVYLTGASSQGFVCSSGCGAGILMMRNNIIQAMKKVGYADAPFDEDYDLYFGGQTQFSLGGHSQVADPKFRNPGSGDFQLQSGSPAIDAGIDVGYKQDFAGTNVPLDGDGVSGAAPDRGAYEFQR